jgi:hypothetical protein
MIIGAPKECNTTMIVFRESPTAIEKQYKTCSAIDANCIILSNSNCLIVLTLRESYFIAVVIAGSRPKTAKADTSF